MQFRDLQKQYEVLQADVDRAISSVVYSAHFISGPQVGGADALALRAWGKAARINITLTGSV